MLVISLVLYWAVGLLLVLGLAVGLAFGASLPRGPGYSAYMYAHTLDNTNLNN
jgi:hypothetical protein